MKPVQLTWIAAAMIGLSPLVQAGFDGAISDDSLRQVGESEVYVPLFHAKGKAGIGSSTGKRVDFDGLASNIFSRTIRNDVYTSGSKHFGSTHYNFAQAANQDVWFGEWYEGDQDESYNNRTVYYVGDNTGTTVPTSGSATYNITGINHFSGSNKLSGTFTADFAQQTLTGDIANASLSINVDSTIDAASASFNGTATANQGGVTTQGISQGHFFGADAATLAGIATFAGNSDLDTAFGGAKE